LEEWRLSSFELSPLDQRIKELNHQGLSNKEISIALKTLYNIELSKSSISRRLVEMRQDPNNDIRLNHVCSIVKPKEEQKWYKIISYVPKEISQYTKLFGFKPSSRTMAYQFQELGLIKRKEVKSFIEATVTARLGWVDGKGELLYPKLDIDCFSDDSRRSLGFYDNSEPQEPIPATAAKHPDIFVKEVINDLKQAVIDYNGIEYLGKCGIPGGYWYSQEEYVEAWEEKNDLLDGFYTLIRDRYIEVKANKGYSSLVWLYRCCEGLKKVTEAGYEPEHIHVGYFGDWDPSGVDQFNYIKKRLNQLGIFGIDLQWIAVTRDQIKKYKLPLMSLETEPGKDPNPNKKEFIRLHGEEATHLNAFFTKRNIKHFKNDILLPWIDQFHDKSIYNEMVEEYDIPPPKPETLIRYSGERLRLVHQNMIERITRDFKSGWKLDAPEYLYEEDEN